MRGDETQFDEGGVEMTGKQRRGRAFAAQHTKGRRRSCDSAGSAAVHAVMAEAAEPHTVDELVAASGVGERKVAKLLATWTKRGLIARERVGKADAYKYQKTAKFGELRVRFSPGEAQEALWQALTKDGRYQRGREEIIFGAVRALISNRQKPNGAEFVVARETIVKIFGDWRRRGAIVEREVMGKTKFRLRPRLERRPVILRNAMPAVEEPETAMAFVAVAPAPPEVPLPMDETPEEAPPPSPAPSSVVAEEPVSGTGQSTD